MRERAAAIGGPLEAGPRPEGGWRVARPAPDRRGAAGAVTGPIRVLLVDDQALVRAGFRALLDSEPDIEVVGEAADGDEAVADGRETTPDVVLMDVQMPRAGRARAPPPRITADPALAGTRVVVLTTFELDEYVFGALHAGASGFLLKDIEPQALIDAVRLVARRARRCSRRR